MDNILNKAKECEDKKMWNDALKKYETLYNNGHTDISILDKIGWCQSRLGLYKFQYILC